MLRVAVSIGAGSVKPSTILRRLIQPAANQSERFNQFAQWVDLGGGALTTEGMRDEQRKFIKHNHLVASVLIFQNCALNRDKIMDPLDSVREFRMPPQRAAISHAAKVAV